MKRFLAVFIVLICLLFAGLAVWSYVTSSKHRQTAIQPVTPTTTTVAPRQEAPVVSEGIFHADGLRQHFISLTLDDLPSFADPGYHIPVAVRKDFVFAAAEKHLIKYDLTGKFVGMTYLEDIDCGNDLAVMGDDLFVACWGKGLYQIDLTTNKIVYKFGLADGLSSLENLQLAVDGQYLWIGTFDGVTRLDPKTRQTQIYRQELGVPGTAYDARVFVEDGQV